MAGKLTLKWTLRTELSLLTQREQMLRVLGSSCIKSLSRINTEYLDV